MASLIIRNGNVVTARGVERADVAIEGERIAEVASGISGGACEEIDANGLHVFPGILDTHVHFNEPGREIWEGIETGSAALAAGGGTLFADMPLNASPPSIDRESFEKKRALCERKSLVDFALWGGLVPGNMGCLEELEACGAIGFKAFMCDSGIADFPCVTPAALREGMKRAAQLRLPVAVHAEDQAMAAELAQAMRASGRTGVRDYLESRPVALEVEAIRVATELAGETGCALHLVHVSSPEGLELIATARVAGVDVTAETCPHYLLLNEDDMVKLGAPAKCAPPLRGADGVRKLWEALRSGGIDTIGSDHSPAPPEMKTAPDFFKVWGGVSGCQHGFALLLAEAFHAQAAPLITLAQLFSGNPARRFGLAGKGELEPGRDADLMLVDFSSKAVIRREELLYRHKQSPYIGCGLRARVARTILRGRTVWDGVRTETRRAGRFVRREPNS